MTESSPETSATGTTSGPSSARTKTILDQLGELYPFRQNHLDIDGLRMHYVDEGEGAPVLMVHGNPSWSFYYRGLVSALRGRRRCIVPDHIGCGLSDKPSDELYEYTLSRRVDDLSRVVDHLGIERTDLIVHDWGGMIGMTWAIRNPDRVGRIVVLNTGAFHLPSSKGFPAALTLARSPGLGGVLVRGFSAFSRGANRYGVTRRPMTPEVAKAYLLPYATWSDRIAVHRFVQDIPLHRNDPAYGVVSETAAGLERLRDHEMLICWGMRDFVFDNHFLAEWIRRFPDAEVHRFADAGHYVLEDAFEEIEPLVQRFLQVEGPAPK